MEVKERELSLTELEKAILNSLAAGLTLKEIAANSGKPVGTIRARMNFIRTKNEIPTTEKLMYLLGESGLLKSNWTYEFPIGI